MNDFYYPQAAHSGGSKGPGLKAGPEDNMAYVNKHGLWENPNWAAQAKLDGCRFILHKDMEGHVRIYSRRISKKTGLPVIKTEQLQHIADEFKKLVPNGTVFDGEVVAAVKSKFNDVTAITGSLPERAIELQEAHGYLIYKAFDLLAVHGKDQTAKTFNERDAMLGALLHGHTGVIHTLGLHFGDDKRKLYDTIIQEGGEGIILKDLHATYSQGKRPKSWVKVKRLATYDVVFMGIEEAEEFTLKKGDTELTRSRIAGKAGAITFGQYAPQTPLESSPLFEGLGSEGGPVLTEFGSTSGFDDAVRNDITANWEKYVGRVFEISAQERFPRGTFQNPRFIQWRPDKRAEDCVYRADES